MSSKKRYANSFFLTLVIYASLIVSLVFGVQLFNDPKPIVIKEKTIWLNHVSMVEQKKEEKPKEKIEEPIKEEPKKEKPKEPVKEKEIEKPIEKPTPIKKPLPKKLPELKKEVINKEVVKNNKEVKEKIDKNEEKVEEKPEEEVEAKNEKEQEFMQKSLPQNYEQEFLDEHLQQIVKLIQQHIIYPKRAKSLNIQGEVLLKFKILISGEAENIEALKGHMLLKNSALEAIEKASKSFPKVKKEITIQVPIVYSLVNAKP